MSPRTIANAAIAAATPIEAGAAHPPETLYGALYLPDHAVQAFVRNDPDLRRKPIAVLDGTFPLFTVVAANRFARKMGVSTGMIELQLEQFLCLVVRHRSPEQEDATHQALLDCAHCFTPRVENTGRDTITLDLNGLGGLWGTPRSIAQRLFRTAAKLGLEARVAIGPNPEAAIHAARSEAGITVMSASDAEEKLAALPLNILPATEEVAKTFWRWGLHTFRDLNRLPVVEVSERLGPDGVHLQQMAAGKTVRPLRPLEEKLYFKESMEPEHSINTLEPLTFILSRLLNQITARLSARNRATNTVKLTLGQEQTATRRPEDFVRTIRLPLPIRDPKILLKLFQLDLDMHRPPAPVVHVMLEAEPVEPRRAQDGLFVPLAPEPEKLELTLARIGSIVGKENIGSVRVLDTHRRDAFHVERFTLPAKSTLPKNPSKTRPQPSCYPRATHLSSGAGRTSPAPPMALRIFRPSQPATVEMLNGKPSRLLFGGKAGKVLTARGPWHASGEWWRSDPWNREEWDVEVQTGWRKALYRIYHDPRRDTWFVDGSYD